MPIEIYDKEEFRRIAERAIECRIKRLKDIVKIKARTKRYLYTIKLKPEEADEFLKTLKCAKIREV